MALKKFDPKVIPWLAAATTAIMLCHAAVDHFGMWGWLIGPLAGLVASFSLATAGSKIGGIAKNRKVLAYISLIFMVAISPIVIALSDSTPDAATWAWAMFPDAAILLASAVTGQSLLAKSEDTGTPVTTSTPQVASKKKKTVRKSVREADLIAYILANRKASQQQVADHFGVSRSAIGQRVAKLVKNGKLKI